MASKGRFIPILNIAAKPLRALESRTSLPTIGNVISAIFHCKNENVCTYAAAVKTVTIDAMYLWQINSLPTVSKNRIQQIAQKYLKKYNRLTQVGKNRRTKEIFSKQCAEFKVKLIWF